MLIILFAKVITDGNQSCKAALGSLGGPSEDPHTHFSGHPGKQACRLESRYESGIHADDMPGVQKPQPANTCSGCHIIAMAALIFTGTISWTE